jgi:uncharacterized protein (TIGR02147 family)
MPIDAQLLGVDVFQFSEPGAYLSTVMSECKRKKKDFRLSVFATGAGFRSPSLVSMILNGKRKISPSAAEKLANALSLRGLRKRYFLTLGRSQYCRSTRDKIDIQEEMVKLKSRFAPTLLHLSQYRFLSNWYVPAIYVMAGQKNMCWDPEWICQRLGRGITLEQVTTALSDLVALGLLLPDKQGYKRLLTNPTTGDEIRNAAVTRYHQQMVQLAGSALDLPLQQREMNGLTISIPESQLPVIKERIREFRKSLHDYLAPMESESEHVYQLNVQMFRLTQSVQIEAVLQNER